MSIVRDNLMEREGYTPYCGREACDSRWPRTHFMHGQFHCICGWKSSFDPEFITKYQAKWAPSVSPRALGGAS